MCKRHIPDNVCQLVSEKVKCNKKAEHQSMCLLHSTIWDTWYGAGGYEILENKSLSLVEKHRIFMKDMHKLNIDYEVEFNDELIYFLERDFSRIFKEKNK